MTSLFELWNQHLVALSLQLTVLVGVAGLLSLVLYRASPRVRYVLWALVLVRALVPVVAVSPVGLLPAPPAPEVMDAEAGLVAPAAEALDPVPPAAPMQGVDGGGAAPARGLAPGSVLAGGWVLGVAGLASAVLLRHRRQRRRIAAGDPPPPEVEAFVERTRRRMGIPRPVEVRIGGSGPGWGPAVVGVRRPVLALPAWLVTPWDEETCGPLVVHELVHFRRRDGWVNLAVTAVQVLYFFHPLVWLATWRFLRERERVCDDEVVAAYQGRAAPYVRALCRFALAAPEPSPVSAVSSLAASRADLVGRIERLAEPGYRSPRRGSALWGLAVAAVLAGVLVSFGAREPTAARPRDTGDATRLEDRVRERADDLELPLAAIEANLRPDGPRDREAIRRDVLYVARSGARLGELGVLTLYDAARRDEWLAGETLAVWLDEIRRHPEDRALLRQTTYFAARLRPELAASLARRGEALDPHDPFWPFRLGESATARARATAGPARSDALAEAASAFGRAAERGAGIERLEALARAARAELERGRPAAARRLARAELEGAESIAGEWYEGNAVHEAHVLLGFAALAEGATDDAERHLMAAAAAPPSPSLRSFGPDMSLAAALLELGRSRAVLDYLDACKGLWTDGRDEVETWAAQIRRGEPPDFRADLLDRR